MLPNIYEGDEIDSFDISYLLYKTKREEYRKLLSNDDFNTVDKLIEHLNIFASNINRMNSNHVMKLIDSFHYFSQILNENNDHFLNVMNNIYNAFKSDSNEEFKQLFNLKPYLYYDLIFNFEKILFKQ